MCYLFVQVGKLRPREGQRLLRPHIPRTGRDRPGSRGCTALHHCPPPCAPQSNQKPQHRPERRLEGLCPQGGHLCPKVRCVTCGPQFSLGLSISCIQWSVTIPASGPWRLKAEISRVVPKDSSLQSHRPFRWVGCGRLPCSLNRGLGGGPERMLWSGPEPHSAASGL